VPDFTPLGRQLYEKNKAEDRNITIAQSNDPHARYCDPFGFPRNMSDEIRIIRNAKKLLRETRVDLQRAWSETSFQMQAMRDNPECAQQEYDRILDAAETVFMAHGYEGASMRQITGEAGVNLAAVNYHFGGKEGLFQAALKRRLDLLNSERLRVLDELERRAAGAPLKPSQIVDAFFGTLLRLGAGEGGETFLRLLGRTYTEPAGFIGALMAREYADVMERYKEALFRALPDVPKEEIVWRFHFMLGATSYAVAGTDTLHLVTDWQTGPAADDVKQLLPRLMSFLLGGLRAQCREALLGCSAVSGHV